MDGTHMLVRVDTLDLRSGWQRAATGREQTYCSKQEGDGAYRCDLRIP